jgi:Zn-dependent protease with chaperone function
MITTKGQIIDINGKTEWLLFHRLSKKVNPVDFLALTDSLIQFPNFLFTFSFLLLTFTHVDQQIKFIVPASLYFLGQIIVNLRVGTGIFKPLNMPLLIFQKFNLYIMAGTFAIGFYFIGLWNLMIIPAYLLAVSSSLLVLVSNQKKFYKKHWNKTVSLYEIFRNNAFLHVYQYYSIECKLTPGISPTEDEIKNQDWLKPYNFMRTHWENIELHFNKKARTYWEVYLNLNK